MAEVSNLHRHRQPPSSRRLVSIIIGSHLEETVHEEEEFYNQPNPMAFDFDSFSHPSFLDDYATSVDFGFDLNSDTENLGCEYEDPNLFFFGGEEDDELQMNFVTDLFGTHQNYVKEDVIWERGSDQAEDPDLEFGFGPGIGSNMGLRVVDMDLESDSDEFEVYSGSFNNDEDIYDSFGVSNNNYHTTENEREEFEWEEVSERIHYDERENLNLVINRIEEISVTPDISCSDGENSSLGDDEGAEEERIEWEVLLALNNLERAIDFENLEENNNESESPHINLPEDYILSMEYDAVFGPMAENVNASKGSPPTAKSVMENLPCIVLTKEEVAENNSIVICPVCKDNFAIGEKVTRMPCCHLYHKECIFPWLNMRNTCPVCRYELPTDDADYEKRRSGSMVDDFEVRYNFELLP